MKQYYYCGDKLFISKIKALEYSDRTGVPAKYYYHDDVYDTVAWKIEPKESLDALYLNQAKRLREKYDYLILCYSGGSDSSNILETYHFNNIKLDKIVTVGALSQDSRSGVDENHNGELYHNVFPYIEKLGLSSITEVVDYTKYFNNVENFSLHQYGEDWIDYVGAWFSPHHWFWRDFEKFVVPHQWRSKKVAIIFGKDKPALTVQEDGKMGFRFVDNAVSGYGNVETYDNSDRINFYWDPTYPDILVKQIHVLKRAYQVSKTMQHTTLTKAQVLSGLSVNDLVYSLRQKLVFESPKSKSSLLSVRDLYLRDKKTEDVYKFYQLGINHLKNKIPNKPQPVFSKLYEV